MFFSLIRAPNQFSPKSKVVDLLSLYNFYFGQISCSHMKFGVLGGQTLLKIIQTNSTRLLCSRRRMRAPTATAPATPRVGHRRTSPAVLARRPYLPKSRVRFSSPSPSSRAWVETSSNRAIAGRRADHPRRRASIRRAPSRFTSPEAPPPLLELD